jgi:hypothetical protein
MPARSRSSAVAVRARAVVSEAGQLSVVDVDVRDPGGRGREIDITPLAQARSTIVGPRHRRRPGSYVGAAMARADTNEAPTLAAGTVEVVRGETCD